MFAAKNGHLDVLMYLVDVKGAGCGDTIKNNFDKTCLDLASNPIVQQYIKNQM
jgi:hypothetical protein